MIIEEHKCVLIPSKLLKHSRPCYVNKPIKFDVHEENAKIRPVRTIKHYINKPNSNIAHDSSTFQITHGKPFKVACEETISRWVKEVMTEAGIGVSKYNTHSCRPGAEEQERYIKV